MLIFGIDCGFSGAWGAITHNGNYHACGDMHNKDKHLESTKIWGEICLARDRQDCEVIVESVHAMPGQGVSSMFRFGTAYGGALALAERFDCPWHPRSGFIRACGSSSVARTSCQWICTIWWRWPRRARACSASR